MKHSLIMGEIYMIVSTLATLISENTSNSIWFNIIIFVVGLIILIKGADWFIEAASFIAKKAHVPDIVIGLTLVSIGTSLPELATNVYAVINDNTRIAVGNAIGSNITNIALVLGIGAIIMRRIGVAKKLFKRDCMFMIFVTVLIAIIPWFSLGDNSLHFITRVSGIILVILTVIYIIYLLKSKDDHQEINDAIHEADNNDQDEEHHHDAFKNIFHASIFFVIGLVLTIYGAKLLVDSVVTVSRQFKLNEEIVSATIVAFGTSVPELAVTISGAVKGKKDIALGNIIGSNIFNIILILGVTSTIKSLTVTNPMLMIVMPIMVGLSILLLIFMRLQWELKRWHGVILLLIYVGYIAYNVMAIK